jgi:solute carrier family 25 protein 39/40
MASTEIQVPISIRLLAASSGAVLTSFFTTPFDLIKIRLQAQAPVAPQHVTQSLVWQDCALRSCGLPPQQCWLIHQQGGNWSPTPQPLRYTGSLDALVKTIRHEGILRLWRGLDYALMMSVPATMFYFAAYDELSYRFSRWAADPGSIFAMAPSLIPVCSGAAARMGTATFIGPLELLRTRLQSSAAAAASHRNVFVELRQLKDAHGLTSLWRGLGPTLWRDVPFSAFYWFAVEYLKIPLRQRLHSPTAPPGTTGFQVAFLAGAGASILASVLTNPFDVAKTRIQVAAPPHQLTTWSVLAAVLRTEGPAALMIGLVPRLFRVVPACAIMIGSYDFCKIHFSSAAPSSSI